MKELLRSIARFWGSFEVSVCPILKYGTWNRPKIVGQASTSFLFQISQIAFHRVYQGVVVHRTVILFVGRYYALDVQEHFLVGSVGVHLIY